MKEITTSKSAWKHKNEWFILPCPKIMMDKTGIKTVDIYLTFEISWFCGTAYFSFVFNGKNRFK